jgi:hypothetical protein
VFEVILFWLAAGATHAKIKLLKHIHVICHFRTTTQREPSISSSVCAFLCRAGRRAGGRASDAEGGEAVPKCAQAHEV